MFVSAGPWTEFSCVCVYNVKGGGWRGGGGKVSDRNGLSSRLLKEEHWDIDIERGTVVVNWCVM